MHSFIQDQHFITVSYGPTFIHPNGRDSSEIDHFLYRKTDTMTVVQKRKLDNLPSNVSDHYPILCTIQISSGINTTSTEDTQNKTTQRINWNKVDLDLYSALVEQGISCLVPSFDSVYKIGTILEDINSILTKSAEISYERPKYRKTN